MWAPAEPALPSKVVHLELLSARAQEQQEERLRSSPSPSPSPSTWSQTVPSSYVGGSSQPEFGASFTQQPQTVPPSYVGWSSQPSFGGSVVQQPQTMPPNYYGGGSGQHGFGASVVQHPARDVPPKFLALVQELEAIKASGSPPPSWSSLISRVKQRQPSVLSEAGVKKWPEYLYLAEKEGVVELQRRQPDRIGGMKVILRMSPNYDGGSAQPGFGASSKQQRQTVPPSYGEGSNQPIFGAPSIQQPQTASVSYSVGSSQRKFRAFVVQHGARDVPPKFLVLVQELEAIKATGSPAPRWNDLGKLVKQRVPSVVSDAGVQ
ncbi:hypothetical protein FRC04_005631 [Tulasnella sp. 424]|nr:hypothetical protein FRC04_005631 [Tulasnella sp. 424]